MTLETLAQLGEFLGGFGVIFTLVYLAIQVRNNTGSQRADMTARVLERLAAQQHTFGFDADANKFFMQAVSGVANLSIEDRGRFQWVMTEFLSSMEFLMQQHESGNVEPQVWLRWAKTLDFWLSFPGVKTYWACRATPYTEEFTQYIDQQIAGEKYSFNRNNYASYMLSGKVSEG
ncbi:hypothetical protein EYC98_18720 [Halieaceae bacterium IMCC14734]|uniref:DUF4760 domain-containing protein n=1 Tax=Candidatus Litorirhabdus singularis TaxID=2518993 RepID=A0ABT3TKS1_9GAMM|nr:hypothetical protein [Candidatus Litorirhabdus singularis]MCX2982900.1 hypothetical protein [Candidatus Litorirhabdus singularis]